MIGDGEVWAIIPARSGSRGLPGKNVRQFAGLPLLAWSIKHAQENRCVDRVIVSSDSSEYLVVAMDYGATARQRSARAARDDATMYDVLRDYPLTASDGPKWIAVYQPTNPMRQSRTIDDMASVVSGSETEPAMVFTARKVGTDPWLAWWFSTGGDEVTPVSEFVRPPDRSWCAPRQKLAECVAANGNGWLIRRDFAQDPNDARGPVIPIVEGDQWYHDINTLDDFNRIEKLFKERKGLNHGTPIYADSGAYPD